MTALETYRDAALTLPGLVATARDVLSQVAAAPADERVTPIPDERTLRWYRSLGLLDAPVRQRGREGVYGYRHVLQAVCVKAMQIEGHTLAQIQKALRGATTPALEARAHAALGLPAPAVPEVPGAASLRILQLAPGVTVSVDPGLVADPDALLAMLARSMTQVG